LVGSLAVGTASELALPRVAGRGAVLAALLPSGVPAPFERSAVDVGSLACGAADDALPDERGVAAGMPLPVLPVLGAAPVDCCVVEVGSVADGTVLSGRVLLLCCAMAGTATSRPAAARMLRYLFMLSFS
jgi:hypothetical protein